MTEDAKPTLTLDTAQKRAPGRPPKKSRKFKRGSNQATWDYVPPELIPEGYVAEWKRTHVLGQPEQPDYGVFLTDQGWEEADAKKFAPMLPPGWEKNTVDRRGQRLYLRPQYLVDEAKAEEKAAADEQIRSKMEQIGLAPQGQFDRKAPSIKTSYERVEVPKE